MTKSVAEGTVIVSVLLKVTMLETKVVVVAVTVGVVVKLKTMVAVAFLIC